MGLKQTAIAKISRPVFSGIVPRARLFKLLRCEEGEPDRMIGTIEDVGKDRKDKFAGLSELCEKIKVLHGKQGKRGK